MQTIEAKKNLLICAGEGGRTAVYCKECSRHGYPEIQHKRDCLTGQALAVRPIARSVVDIPVY